MLPVANTEEVKQRMTKRTVIGTVVWFVLLAGVLVIVAFGGHL